MRTTTFRLAVLALVTAVALAACGGPGPQPDPDPQGFSPNFEVSNPEMGVGMGVSLVVVTTEAEISAASAAGVRPDLELSPGEWLSSADAQQLAAPAQVGPMAIEIDTGIWIAAVGLIDLDGNLEMTFPEPEDLPAALANDWLLPADEFILQSILPVGCTVVADDPDVMVSVYYDQLLLSVPGLFGVLAGQPVVGVITTTTPLDVDEPIEDQEPTFVAWLYADGDVNLSSEGAACDAGDPTFGVDVALQAGWNQVGWAVTAPGGGEPVDISLVNVDDDATIYVLIEVAL